MKSVIYYSNTGTSFKVAEYLALKSGFKLENITNLSSASYHFVILVFPIHSQNIPNVVRQILEQIKVDNWILVATYGKMAYGNALYELHKKYHLNIVGGAYVPTKHAYIDDDYHFVDYYKLDKLLTKIKNPHAIKIPKSYKNPLANLMIKKRAQLGVEINLNSRCNKCNKCGYACKNITLGKINKNCIRCMKCIQICPQKALEFRLNPLMKWYLRKKKCFKLVIYV